MTNMWESHDEIVGIGLFRCFFDFFTRGIFFPVTNIFVNAGTE